MAEIRNVLENQFRINPSLAVLTGLLFGILPFAVDPEIKVMSALVFPVIFLSATWILLQKRLWIKIGISASAGFLLSFGARIAPETHYDSILPEKNCGAIIEAEVVDTTCSCSEESSWMDQPYLMKINVRRLKYTESDEWKIAEGYSAAILPRECPRLGYGDIILMRGSFILPEPPLFKGDFNFERFLLASGIRRIFESESCEIETRPGKFSFYRNILLFRDFLMNKSVDGMENIENKKIGAAINFGCRQGMSSEDRRNFLKSGTIHIFSISGLNVAIIAVMLFWVFRWIPFTARHLLIPVIIFLYVFTTGMPPPAVRAFLMISVWCIQRAFLYPSSSMNSVYFAASAILIFNPFAVLDVGFQFSFIVAGFLVLSWNNSERWVASALELSKWIPAQGGLTFYLTRTRFTRTLIRSLITSFVAWLSGIGLCLVYQGIFIPSSIITNFAIIPFVSLFSAAVVVKILMFPIIPVAKFADFISEWSLDIIRSMSELGASFGNEYLLKPPVWMLAVFYVALVVLVISRRKMVFLLSASAVVIMISFWYWKSSLNPALVFVISGGTSQEPVIVICPPGRRDAFIVNAGSKQAAKPVLNILAKRGIDCIDTLLICESRKDFCAGARYILTGSKVSCLVMPEKYKQSWFSKMTIEAAYGAGSEIKFLTGEREVFSKGNLNCRFVEKRIGESSYFIQLVLPESSVEISIRDKGQGLKKLEIRASGSNNKYIELINTSIPVLREFKL